jgi:predicted metal-dependent phosphotriesterase family hydrolase
MNLGYGRSLGVSWSHCHVVEDWACEARPQKQIARDMAQMVTTINTQLLRNIQNLKGPNSIVNCTTCHRGRVKPALNLPP